MGNSPTKSHDFDNRSVRSFSRRSSARNEDVKSIAETIRILRGEVTTFEGVRGDDKYNNYQELLAQSSQELQNIRMSMRNKKKSKQIDNIQKDISDSIKVLEERVRLGERNLDQGAVESHSFMQVTTKNRDVVNEFENKISKLEKKNNDDSLRKKPQGRNYHKDSRISSLNAIEENVLKLESDIQLAIDLEDKKQFVMLEKKIQIFYTDLELVDVDSYTPLQERKEYIGTVLVRLNNKIKKAKQNMNRKSASHEKDSITTSTREPEDTNSAMETILKIQENLDELEAKTISFNGTKSEQPYKRIKEAMNSNWTTIQRINMDSDVVKKYKQSTQERMKNIMHTLNEKTKQNEVLITKQTEELKSIRIEVKKFHKLAEEFKGPPGGEKYDFIDQNLRKLWASLAKIGEHVEEVSLLKKTVIEDIQTALKILSGHANKSEKSSHSGNLTELCKAQKEVWSKIVQNLDVDNLGEVEQEAVAKDLENLCEELQDQLKRLKKDDYKKRSSFIAMSKRDEVKLRNKIAEERSALTVAKSTNNLDDLLDDLNSPTKLRQTTVVPGNPRVSFDLNNDFASKIFGQYQTPPNRVQEQPINVTVTSFTIPKNRLTYIETSFDSPRSSLNEKSNHTIDKISPKVKQQKLLKQSEVPSSFGTTTAFTFSEDFNSPKMTTVETYSIVHSTNEQPVKNGRKSEEPVYATITKNDRKTLAKDILDIYGKNKKQMDAEKAQNAENLDKIMAIDAIIQQLDRQIDSVKSLKKDNEYDEIEDKLMECLIELNKFNTKGEENLKSAKDEILQQIRKLQDKLKNKLKQNENNTEKSSNTEANILKSLIEEAQLLKKRVDCFSGTYRSIQYQQIEENIKTCMRKIEEVNTKGNSKLEDAKKQTIAKLDQWLKILDEKSLKVDNSQSESSSRLSFDVGPGTSFHKLEIVRGELLKLKNSMENFRGTYKDENYENIMRALKKSNSDLIGIPDNGSASTRVSIDQYRDYIVELSKYFETKLDFVGNKK